MFLLIENLIFNGIKNRLTTKAMRAARVQELNIPNAPMNTNAKGKINFKTLKIKFFIKTNFAFLKTINMGSIKTKNT